MNVANLVSRISLFLIYIAEEERAWEQGSNIAGSLRAVSREVLLS